jgi:hypothetical protein
LDLIPEETRAKYEAALSNCFTVIPFYVVRHEGSVEESKDPSKFDTAIHKHFTDNRKLLTPSSWYTETHTKMLDLMFNQLNQMQLVVNNEPQASVCKFCENYFRAVSGMCHFKRSQHDRSHSTRAEAGRLLCAMKILYKSDMDDVPDAVEAPYEVNLLKELAAVNEA